MANITITIPTDKIDLVKEALGYQDKILNEERVEIDNPQSALEFAEEWILYKIKAEVLRHEQRQAVQNATYTDTSDIV